MAREDAPLGLYFHVPFCHHRCTFCPFFQNTTREGFSSEYAGLLRRAVASMAAALGKDRYEREVQTLYFGGGTPSDMEAADLASVVRLAREQFAFSPEAEVTVEGRVRGFTAEKARVWMEAGVNRFSLGLQSSDTRLRRSLGRLADREEIVRNLNALSELGAIVIVDLIYGLPGQSLDMVREDIRFLAEETRIDGLDLYALKPFPGSPMMKAVQAGRLPEPTDAVGRGQMYVAASDALAGYGFEHFTPQHWRRSARERSAYNRLAKVDADILPFGCSAGGHLGPVAMMNERDLGRYRQRIEVESVPAMMMGDPANVGYGKAFRLVLADALEERSLPPLDAWPQVTQGLGAKLLANWMAAGLVEAQRGDELRLTRAGCFWASHLQKLLLGLVAGSASAG